MLHIVFVEAALETVPPSILRHPSVRRSAKRQGKRPEEVLLNRSIHHSAMSRLPEDHKRGRPDIAQICLLEALGAPLNKTGGLRVWLHTFGGHAIEVSPEVRVPRDCNRFNGLMEQLLTQGRVPPGAGDPLIQLSEIDLGGLKERIAPSHTVALTSHGSPSSLEELCGRLSLETKPLVFIGAFPHGPMRDETLSLTDEAVSIHAEPLEAWVVTSRLIYEYEKTMSGRD
jgi:rRNA small subunit pseudouridine methyltransferase Nep1